MARVRNRIRPVFEVACDLCGASKLITRDAILWRKRTGLSGCPKCWDRKPGNHYSLQEVRCVRCGKSRMVTKISLYDHKTGKHRNMCLSCAGRGADGHGKGWTGGKFISGRKFNTWRDGARKRKIEFCITVEDVETMFIQQNGKCALSGRSLSLIAGRADSLSLDRIDNAVGYVIGNIQLACWRANAMKRQYTEAEFFEWCKYVADHRDRPPLAHKAL